MIDDSAGAPGKRRFRDLLIRLVIVTVIVAWVVAGAVALSVDVTRTRLIAVAVAALITELGLYVGAALVGLRVFEARRAIWQRVKAFGRQ